MFTKVHDLVRLNRALNEWDGIRKEMTVMDPKSLLLSKTFWFNALTFAATMSGFLPTQYALPIAAVVNIGLRILTNQPVTIPIPFKDNTPAPPAAPQQ